VQSIFTILFLARREDCPESYCHDPGVGVTPQGKNFNLDYIFWTMGDRMLIFHIYISWRDLSFCTKTFDLVTFILNFDLVLKNFNLSYIFWNKYIRAFILKIWMHYEDTFF
jgi:hypothetical protein